MIAKNILSGVTRWKFIDKVKQTYMLHPQLSNACTGFLTFTMGDIIAQKLDTKKDKIKLDLARSVQLGLLGFVMNGFFLHRWYVTLDKVVGKFAVSSKVAVAAKVVADQLIYAPFAIISFFGYACVFRPSPTQNNSIRDSFESRISNDFTTTFLADCTLWPVANFVNFRFVPLMFRASFSAVTQLFWQMYLSVVTHMAAEDSGVQATAVDVSSGMYDSGVDADRDRGESGGGSGGGRSSSQAIARSGDLALLANEVVETVVSRQ